MSEAIRDLSIIYGSIEIHATERREGDDLVFGGFRIERDRAGKEVRRTADEENVRLVGWYSRRCWT